MRGGTATLDGKRAGILKAVGRDAEAVVLRQAAAERLPDFTTLGALAVLEACRGKVGKAEHLYRGGQEPPEQLGCPFTTWSLSKLPEHTAAPSAES